MSNNIERAVAELARDGLTASDIGAALRMDPRAVERMMPRSRPNETTHNQRSRPRPGYPRAEVMRSEEPRR